MREEKDIVTVEILPKKEEPEPDLEQMTVEIFTEEAEEEPEKEKKPIELGISSIQGTRKYQEDTVFGHAEGERALAIICDGMGGLAGGAQASQTAVESLAGAYFAGEGLENIPEFWKAEARQADRVVFELEDEQGQKLSCGTTVVAAMIENGVLYWLSVGDSRIYIIRGEEIVVVNEAHNYRAQLDDMLQKGEISQEKYQEEEYRAEALTSYLGMGNVSMIDVNQNPFPLKQGDAVLLSSDGLYRSLTDEDILKIVRQEGVGVQQAAENLTAVALEKSSNSQDNTSVVILGYEVENK